MENLSNIKDPVLRAKVELIMNDPSGNVSVELSEQDMEALAGAGKKSISAALGNKGHICTITKECQACCN
ncbi:Lantibiotic alpha [Lachnospiraceae bacterium KH1T2]|nr:Lantibiotic alpha [Lachnospiraceae bacterium KH1T2]